MAQIINTNIASLNAQRNLNASQRGGDEAMQRLSSGLRINSAKDDAAGMAISTRFGVQIAGSQVAMRNAGDGISLAQTAEGALSSISDSLSRVRELALQASNDTNSDLDRQALQEEVNQLVDEIKNVASNTNFNGKNLLDGSFNEAVFQTGANVGDTISVSIGKLDATTLGSAMTAGISSTQASDNTPMVAGDLVINGVSVGASAASDDTASFAQADSSAIAKAAAINAVSGETGVTATADPNTVQGTELGAIAAAANGDVIINGETIAISMAPGDAATSLTNVAEQINSKAEATGVTATVVETDGGARIDLTAQDGRNITIDGNGAIAADDFGLPISGAVLDDTGAHTYSGGVTLQSLDGGDINLTTKTGNIDNAGFEVGSFSGIQGGAVSNSLDDTAATTRMAAGDLTINGVTVGASRASDDTASTANPEGSAIAKAAAINRISDQTGVTASVNPATVSVDTNGGAIDLDINGTNITLAAGATDQDFIDAVNASSGRTGVTAETLGTGITLTAADGRNIEFTNNVATGFVLEGTPMGAATEVRGGSVTLESAGEFELGSETGNIDNTGFRVGTFGGAESGTKLEDIDISTVEGANAAITAVDNALQTITTKQAELGAIQNRFEKTISNLESLTENLNAANSRIQDADFAAETAKMSKAQVLQQAGISILSQANSRPQQVLSLLQG